MLLLEGGSGSPEQAKAAEPKSNKFIDAIISDIDARNKMESEEVAAAYKKYKDKLVELSSLFANSSDGSLVAKIQEKDKTVEVQASKIRDVKYAGMSYSDAKKVDYTGLDAEIHAIGDFTSLIDRQVRELDAIKQNYNKAMAETKEKPELYKYTNIKGESITIASGAERQWRETVRGKINSIRSLLNKGWDKKNTKDQDDAIHGKGMDAVRAAYEKAEEHDKQNLEDLMKAIEVSLESGDSKFHFEKEISPEVKRDWFPDSQAQKMVITIPGQNEAQKLAGLYAFCERLEDGIKDAQRGWSAFRVALGTAVLVGAPVAGFAKEHYLVFSYIALTAHRHFLLPGRIVWPFKFIPAGTKLVLSPLARKAKMAELLLKAVEKTSEKAGVLKDWFKSNEKIKASDQSKMVLTTILEGAIEEAKMEHKDRVEAIKKNTDFKAEGKVDDFISIEEARFRSVEAKLKRMIKRVEGGKYLRAVKSFDMDTGEIKFNDVIFGDVFMRALDAGQNLRTLGATDLRVWQLPLDNVSTADLGTTTLANLRKGEVRDIVPGRRNAISPEVGRLAKPVETVRRVGQMLTRRVRNNTNGLRLAQGTRSERMEKGNELFELGKDLKAPQQVASTVLGEAAGEFNFKRSKAELAQEISGLIDQFEDVQKKIEKQKGELARHKEAVGALSAYEGKIRQYEAQVAMAESIVVDPKDKMAQKTKAEALQLANQLLGEVYVCEGKLREIGIRVFNGYLPAAPAIGTNPARAATNDLIKIGNLVNQIKTSAEAKIDMLRTSTRPGDLSFESIRLDLQGKIKDAKLKISTSGIHGFSVDGAGELRIREDKVDLGAFMKFVFEKLKIK